MHSRSENCNQPDTGRRVSVSLSKAILIGVGSAGLLSLVLVVWTGVTGGRSPAERAATTLVMPISAFWLFCFAGTITCWIRKHRLVALSFATLWLAISVTFNGYIAGRFLRAMEYPTTADPASSLSSPLDAVVLLGGYAMDNRYEVAELSCDGQRLLLAAQLWHSGKVKTLICTGTAIEDARDPSMIGRELLVSVGVPNEVIFEVPGVNTAAEMKSLEQFFESPPEPWLKQIQIPGGEIPEEFDPARASIGLVTTAVHLSRAMRLAADRDLRFTPLGCKFNGRPVKYFSPRQLIPDSGAGNSFAIALKEALARIVGR